MAPSSEKCRRASPLYDDVWGPPAAPIVDAENEYMASIEQAGAPGLRAAEERAYFVARALVPLQVLATVAVRRGGRVRHYYALHH